MKNFHLSKINILALITIIASISEAVYKLDLSVMTFQTWFAFGSGCLLIILRTWYTNQPIKTKKAMREKRSKPNLN